MLTSKIAVEVFEEAAEDFQIFRIKTVVNGVVFYSENLTRAHIINKTSEDAHWILSFEGVTTLEAQEAEGDWVEV